MVDPTEHSLFVNRTPCLQAMISSLDSIDFLVRFEMSKTMGVYLVCLGGVLTRWRKRNRRKEGEKKTSILDAS